MNGNPETIHFDFDYTPGAQSLAESVDEPGSRHTPATIFPKDVTCRECIDGIRSSQYQLTVRQVKNMTPDEFAACLESCWEKGIGSRW